MSTSMQANTGKNQEKNLGHMPGRAASSTGSSHNEKMDEERHDANTCTHEEAPKEKDNLGWKQLAELLQARLDAAAKEREDLAKQVEALEMKLGESGQLLAAAEARAQTAEAAEARAQAAEELLGLISEELRCPLTLARFRHPVVAPDGHTYERAAIRRWAREQPTSPLTREPLQGPVYENRWAAKVGSLLPAAGLPSDAEEESDSASEPEVPRAWGPSLHESIFDEREAEALRLLQAPQVLGLNVLQDRMSVLTMAIHEQLWEVVRAILARPDFVQMNAGENQWTALHEAAAQGRLWLCRAILERPDFEALGALDNRGRTAADVAAACGHQDLADFLTSAMEAA